MTDAPPQEPAGCTTALLVVAAVFSFVVAATWYGIATTNLALYFAALPASAILSLFGTELILAWPLDGVLWISAAWMLASRVRPSRMLIAVASTIGIALVFGFVISRFVEPTGSIL